ncbi:MAG: hypothetical protein HYS23_13900 [Geobacter sp.]|nr:hypothetical protein [Geobacter sp.]
MQKEKIVDRTREALEPLETGNIVEFIRNLSLHTFEEKPWLILVFLAILFYAVIRRSRFVLLFLFAFFSIVGLITYAMPTEGELSARSLLPLALGGLAVGGVIIYVAFIKTE